MNNWETFLAIINFELPLLIHTGLIIAAPLVWAVLGGVISERSGIINIGLEGMMLIGAFAAVVGSSWSGNPWIGLTAGMIGGGLIGLLHGWISIRWKANQIVSGMGINLIALGLTGFFLFRIFQARGNSPEVEKIPSLLAPTYFNEWFERLLFPFSYLHILLIMLLFATIVIFYKTRFGLRLRACGEDPYVVKSAGLSVEFYQYAAICISGILAGLGGVQLSISDVCQFSTGMTNGRGFIALAIVICSGWRPGRAAWICFAFGCIGALSDRLQSSFTDIPSRLLLALPFLLALLILATRKHRSYQPAALGKTI